MKYLAFILVLCLLTIPNPTSAQTPEPYIDPCDELPLRDWSNSSHLEVKDGVCVLMQNTMLSTNPQLEDFIVRFRLLLDINTRFIFNYGIGMNDLYEFVVTSNQATLTNYKSFGNASNTVRDTLLAKAPLQIPIDKWVEIEYGMQANRQWLTVDGKMVIDRKTARFHGMWITGSKGVYLDDIQLFRTDLSLKNFQLPNHLKVLSSTWIAYRNKKGELSLMHPDGTGTQVVASPVAGTYLQASFSPDGKILLIYHENSDQLFLSFYSMETLTFIGSEITLPSSPVFDWTPDGQHLIVLRDRRADKLVLEKINIHTGQVIGTIPVPSVIDEQTIQLHYIEDLDCSPTAEIVTLKVDIEVAGQYVTRAILFDLTSKQTHFLPGSELSVWSPDGRFLFSKAGGLINPETLVFTELPGDMVEKIAGAGAWSPNGQFIHVGSKNSGNGEDAVYIVDLEAQKVITLPLISFGSFAPDSLHFVFNDQGRLIIRSMFDETELQIAEGSAPIWQPVPGMFPVEPIQQPKATAEANQQKSPKIATPTDESFGTQHLSNDQDNTSQLGESLGQPEQRTKRSIWASVFIIFSLLGFTITGAFSFLRFFRICPSCKRSSRGLDPFCMYCGTPLRQSPCIANGKIILPMLVGSMGLAIVGMATLVVPQKPNLMTPAISAANSKPAQHNTPVDTSTENSLQKVSRFTCGNSLDLSTADLLTVIETSDAAQENLAQFFTQIMTPVANPTAQFLREESFGEKWMELLVKTCPITFLSISPDNQYILVSGSAATETGYWAALYNRQTYQPIWIQPIQIHNPPFDAFAWSPSGDAFAVSSENIRDEVTITIYEVRTGSQISKIPASTRQGAFCMPWSHDKNQFRWLPDGKRLVRKIVNAVQVLDAASGSVLNEIEFDDEAMGSLQGAGSSTHCIFAFAWSPDGSRFATLGASTEDATNPAYRNGLKIWDTGSGKLLLEKIVGAKDTNKIIFSPDGTKLFLPRGYTTPPPPQIVDTQTGQLLLELAECPIGNHVSADFWSLDSQNLIFQENNNLAIYDIPTQSWKGIITSTNSGRAIAWLDDRGHVLMEGSNSPNAISSLPNVINVLTAQEFSLLEYLKLFR